MYSKATNAGAYDVRHFSKKRKKSTCLLKGCFKLRFGMYVGFRRACLNEFYISLLISAVAFLCAKFQISCRKAFVVGNTEDTKKSFMTQNALHLGNRGTKV